MPTETGRRYEEETKKTARSLAESGLSSTEIAKQLDIPRRTISAWQNTPAPLNRDEHHDAEARRIQGFKLLAEGINPKDVAKQCGVSIDAVLYWIKRGFDKKFVRLSKYTPKEKANAVRLLKKGLTTRAISERLKLNQSAVKNWKRELGVSKPGGPKGLARRPGQRYKPEIKEKALQMYCQGKTSAEISSVLGVGLRTIESWKKGASIYADLKLDSKTKVDAVFALENRRTSKESIADIAAALNVSVPALNHLSSLLLKQRKAQSSSSNPESKERVALEKKIVRELKQQETTGRSVSDIAAMLGTTPRKIYALKNKNIHPSKRKANRWKRFSPEKKAQILECLKENGYRATVELHGVSIGTLSVWKKEAGLILNSQLYPAKGTDPLFTWIAIEHPHLTAWAEAGKAFVSETSRNKKERIFIVNALVSRVFSPFYLRGLPYLPEQICSKSLGNFNLMQPVLKDRKSDKEKKRLIEQAFEFFESVIFNSFSETDDYDRLVPSPAFWNPISKPPRGGAPQNQETVYSALPYGYITELREMMAEGPNFCDWKTAQGLLGVGVGNAGNASHDWFEVKEDRIDRNDPDCVFRHRNSNCKIDEEHPLGVKTTLEMWSPVRHVAILIKLILPLRTYQVRFLDSGEGDTLRYESTPSGCRWLKNKNILAEGTDRRPIQCGVFRVERRPESEPSVLFYSNTNKTADAQKSGAEKGFTFPWYADPHLPSNPFYWAEKLRNWQEKYNPIEHKTRWKNIPPLILRDVKSEQQLAGYSDACFLFRDPSSKYGELPLTDNSMLTVWHHLLAEYENRLAAKGRANPDGTPIRLVYSNDVRTTFFPLHSLRVSLITALALEGKLPFALLQKIVGHSRLMMTLHYFKLSSIAMTIELKNAFGRMDANKSEGITRFLMQTDYDRIVRESICVDPDSVAAVLPVDFKSRNPVGWMPMHNGLCLMGGNTHPIAGKSQLGGCFNGGRFITANGEVRYGHVSGGDKNCIRCRWFITHAAHLWSLVETTNNLLYHFNEMEALCIRRESELALLRQERQAVEEKGETFARAEALTQAQRLFETAMQKWSNLAEDVDASIRLVDRCREALREGEQGEFRAMLAVGTEEDLRIVVGKVDSELLQLSGVCEGVEFFPDLDPGKAIIRRSQLLDAALSREGEPPLFLTLDEQEQLLVGNEFLRRLSHSADPNHPEMGRRRVIAAIDARESLKALGFDFPMLKSIAAKRIPLKALR